MLTSELAALLASRRAVTDDGLAVSQITESGNQEERRRAIALAGKRLQKRLQSLHRLGVRSIENAAPDPDRPDKDYLFIADNDATLAVVRAAFAAGIYCRLLAEQTNEWLEASRDAVKGQKAGHLGGKAKTDKAALTHREILRAYAIWADNPRHEKASNAAFSRQYAAKRKAPGFSRATIQRVLADLNERILAQMRGMKLSALSQRTKAESVARALANQPGISLATVRRALS